MNPRWLGEVLVHETASLVSGVFYCTLFESNSMSVNSFFGFFDTRITNN